MKPVEEMSDDEIRRFNMVTAMSQEEARRTKITAARCGCMVIISTHLEKKLSAVWSEAKNASRDYVSHSLEISETEFQQAFDDAWQICSLSVQSDGEKLICEDREEIRPIKGFNRYAWKLWCYLSRNSSVSFKKSCIWANARKELNRRFMCAAFKFVYDELSLRE